jgi:hypothetical protein
MQGKALMVDKHGFILEGWFDQNSATGYGRLINDQGYYVGNFS